MNIPVKPTPITKILFFDLEWSITKDKFKEHPILAFSYVDTEGIEKVQLIEDFLTDFNGQKRTLFEAEKSLLGVILKVIEQYNWSIGFYTTGVRSYNPKKGKMEGRDSDLMQLHTRLKRHGMEEDSPIWINENNNRPYLTGKNRDHNHIDAYKLFTNKTIKTSLYKNAYSNRSLDSIGRAVVNEGKYNSLSGPVFENIKNLNEKRNYALGDVIILHKCVAKDNYVLLRIIESLSNTTKVSFRDLCNSGGISKVLTEVLDNVVYTELKNNNFEDITAEELATHREKLHYFWTTPTTFTNYNITVMEDKETIEDESDTTEESETKSKKHIPRYIGGLVLKPEKEESKNVSIFDIASLYPTLIINHNISFETINCECCKNDPLRKKVPPHVLPDRNWHICRKFRGVLPMLLEGYREERLMYKNQARTDSEAALKSNVYKILINAAYGYLGFQFAKYGNLQAAELVTRYGRYTLTRCIEIAKQLGWDIIYSDTDSVFSRGEITEEQKKVFIDTCKKELSVTMELDKVFDKLIMTGKKNYIGIQTLPNGEKKAVIVGMSGIKSNQCGWVKNAFLQMVEDYKNDVNPCVKLRKELDKLMSNSIPNAEFMLIKNKNLGRNPEDYSDKVNIVQKVFGAKMGLQEGDTVRYYLADKPIQWSLDITKVSKKAYREQLLKATTPVLRLLGYDTKKEFVKPPRVVLSLSDISKRKKKNKAPKKDILKIENDSDNSSVVTVTEIKEQSKQLTIEDATQIASIVASSKGKSAEISLSKLAMIPKTKKRGKLVQI